MKKHLTKNTAGKTVEIKAGDIVKFNPRTDGIIIFEDEARRETERWEVLSAPANAPLYLREITSGATCGTFSKSVTVVEGK